MVLGTKISSSVPIDYINATAGIGGVTQYQIVMIVNELLYPCDGNNNTHAWKAIGIAKENISAGNSGKVQIFGEINNSSWNLTSGEIYFLSLGGTISSTPGTGFFQKVGIAKTNKILILELGEYKDGLYFGEEEGENPRRTRAFQIRDSIYQRAKELLDDKEYNIFIEAAKEFENGSEKPAGYFTDKDAKFQGWKYTV